MQGFGTSTSGNSSLKFKLPKPFAWGVECNCVGYLVVLNEPLFSNGGSDPSNRMCNLSHDEAYWLSGRLVLCVGMGSYHYDLAVTS